MSDNFEQPKKPTLFRSFESDVARALGVEKEQAETAVIQKKVEFEQRRNAFRSAGAKRFFFLVGGLFLLVVTISASTYLYRAYNKTHTVTDQIVSESIAFEVSGERMKSVVTLTREALERKASNLTAVIFTKSETPLSLSELYALLPFKKGENKSADFSSFLYAFEKKEDTHSIFIVFKENTPTAPQIPPAYDDFMLSLGINLFDLTDEAKELLPDERFTATFVENIPVRSITVRTEKGEEGIVFGRVPGSTTLFIMTKESLRSGLLERVSTSAIVLSL